MPARLQLPRNWRGQAAWAPLPVLPALLPPCQLGISSISFPPEREGPKRGSAKIQGTEAPAQEESQGRGKGDRAAGKQL